MSTILSADDLNDFIAPGVACIKPVAIDKSSDSAEIAIGDDGTPIEQGRTLEPAQISLQDCLACSGCITSSEAMLVELQNPRELLAQQERDREAGSERIYVASVSHQARVSLAKAFGVSVKEVDSRLRGLFVEKLGFRCVVGTEIGRAIALEESWHEFEERRVSQQQHQSQGGVILSSICPGWTLYAEKTHPEILDRLSTVRSPQQITGSLMKQLLSAELSVDPSDIYHVSVMPCFDKKLESARPDFELQGSREVDLVITAKELVDLLANSLQINFLQLPRLSEPSPVGFTSTALISTKNSYPRHWPVSDQFKSNAGSSSGGYLAYIMHRVQQSHPGSEIISIPGKNSDFVEWQVVVPAAAGTGSDLAGGPTVVFRGAQVYGFRNIQNLVRKLKMRRGGAKVRSRKTMAASQTDPTEFDYVEVMACPGGCVNGGGQIGAAANIPAKVWTQEINDVYAGMPQLDVGPALVDAFFAETGVDRSKQLLRTHFKPVERDDSLPAALTVGTQW